MEMYSRYHYYDKDIELDPEFRVYAAKVQQAQTLIDFLRGAADILTNNYEYVRKSPVRYSPDTGEVVEYKNVPYRRWRGLLYTIRDNDFNSVRLPVHCAAELNALDGRTAVFSALGKTFVLSPFHSNDNIDRDIRFEGYRLSEATILA